jgi:pimeloyl-ACP methyl ester carboxylesterase
VVLLHGFGASAYSFRDLGAELGRTRRVVAIDLNGFGYTERPVEPAAYGLDGQLDLVRGVVDALGMRRIDVVGHSYSGYLAMRLARKDPQRVRRLVLISPALELEVAPESIVRSKALRTVVYPLLRGVLSSPKLTRSIFESAYHRLDAFPIEVSEEYRRRLLVEGLGHAYRGFGGQLDEFARDRVAPGDLDHPVLVLAAREDNIIPLESLRQQLDGSDVPLEIIEDSGHSSPEEQPEEVALRILNFLGR